ncbi:MAG: hypothetical protein RLY16_1736, partial [Bacteroidota bacterium]
VIPDFTTVTISGSDANAATITIGSSSNLVMTGSTNFNIAAGGTFTNNGTFNASASTGTVRFLGSVTVTGTTTFKNVEANGTTTLSTGITIDSLFTLNNGSAVAGNSPSYTCPTSSLIYSANGTYTRGLEWAATSSGPGYPANVIVRNNTVINYPIPGNGYVCNDLSIEAGSQLSQNFSGGNANLNVGRNVTINGTLVLGESAGGDLSFGGNWTRNSGGVFTHNNRIVTITGADNFSGRGTSQSTISAPASVLKDNQGGFGGENFAQLRINKAAATDSVVLLSNITIVRQLDLDRGVFSLRNADVTLVSNNTATADIAPITSIANTGIRYSGTGRFVVQRFIQNPTAVRSWRLLTAPLQATDAPSINAAYQSGVVNPNRALPNANGGAYNPYPGYGTHITGAGGVYSSTLGFDHGTNSGSILYTGLGIGSWLTPSSTKNTLVTDKEGWMLFVRGDRGFVIGNQYAPSQNTTLEPKGRVNIGDVSKSVTTGLQVVGNPYPAAISLMNVDVAGTAGSNCNYYMWDPKMFTSYSQPGKWVAFTGVGSGYVYTSSASEYVTNGTIESGQAFVIDAPASGNMTFHESDKLSMTSSLIGIANGNAARPGATTGNPVSILRTDIYAANGGNYTLTDGVLNLFGDGYSNAVNQADAGKMITFNTKESLSLLRDTTKLAIEKREPIVANDTIYFTMSKFNPIAYRLRFTATDFTIGLNAFLLDKYTGSRTPVSLDGVTEYDFVINTDVLSAAADRFKIVFRGMSVLPVKFTKIQAEKKASKTVRVLWDVAQEQQLKNYVVEKSNDGIHFTDFVTVTASGQSQYEAIDASATGTTVYYRVRSVDLDGRFTRSAIARVQMGKDKSGMLVYPNPIENEVIHLQLQDMQTGLYQYRLLQADGKMIAKGSWMQLASISQQQLTLSSKLTTGMYQLEVLQPDQTTKVITVFAK